MSVSARLDSFNCYLAGRLKAEAAVKIALRVAADPNLHKHIPIRDKEKGIRTLFQFPEGCSSAVDMYELGMTQWQAMRASVTKP